MFWSGKVSFCRLGSLGLGNFTCNSASKGTRLALQYSYGIMISNLHWYCWWGRLDQCWSPWSCWSYNSTEVVQGLSLTFWILQTSKPWKPHYSWRGGGMGMGLGPMTIVSASLLWQQSWRQMLCIVYSTALILMKLLDFTWAWITCGHWKFTRIQDTPNTHQLSGKKRQNRWLFVGPMVWGGHIIIFLI